MSLSDRLRPDCEAAPWVIEEVKMLELENARLREALEYVIEMVDYIDTRDTIQKKARAALEER